MSAQVEKGVKTRSASKGDSDINKVVEEQGKNVDPKTGSTGNIASGIPAKSPETDKLSKCGSYH